MRQNKIKCNKFHEYVRNLYLLFITCAPNICSLSKGIMKQNFMNSKYTILSFYHISILDKTLIWTIFFNHIIQKQSLYINDFTVKLIKEYNVYKWGICPLGQMMSLLAFKCKKGILYQEHIWDFIQLKTSCNSVKKKQVEVKVY